MSVAACAARSLQRRRRRLNAHCVGGASIRSMSLANINKTQATDKMSDAPRHLIADLANRATAALYEAGFERAYVSMRTESVYFKMKGRHGLLRLSSHRQKHGPIGQDQTVAKITFTAPRNDAGHLRMRESKFQDVVALAVGQYMLRSARPKESKYTGPKIDAADAKRPPASLS